MWSMPQKYLRIVAVLIAICAVLGFVLGVRGTPEKGRLPGESRPGEAVGGPELQASEYQALPTDAPPRPASTPKPDLSKKVEVAPEPPDPLDIVVESAKPVTSAPKPAPSTSPPGEDRVGDLIDGITPQPAPATQPPF